MWGDGQNIEVHGGWDCKGKDQTCGANRGAISAAAQRNSRFAGQIRKLNSTNTEFIFPFLKLWSRDWNHYLWCQCHPQATLPLSSLVCLRYARQYYCNIISTSVQT